MEHRDHKGNQGLLGPGAVQWMTAGRGIIHSEMPKQQEGKMHGFQMWVNLPAANKMVPPRYQDFQASSIPVVKTDNGGQVKIMAGEYNGVKGASKML
jgi:redox-sensitive bicupin YhaK (pirin superfamily)